MDSNKKVYTEGKRSLNFSSALSQERNDYIDTIFCSLDQSTKLTGWCIWKNGKYETSGLIDFSQVKEPDVRFNNMLKSIMCLLDKYSPAVVYIEDTALQRNAKTLKELSQLQGVIIGYCKTKNIDIQIISPGKWRKQLGFKQGAGVKRQDLKKQCFDWVKKNFGIEKSEDEVEAIGIGAAVLKIFKENDIQ